jgi:hypothetical protein
MLPHGKADEQGVAADRATPLRALAVRDVRAAGQVRVQLLEGALVAASGAIPDQMRHPGGLLVAMQHGLAGNDWVAADSRTVMR